MILDIPIGVDDLDKVEEEEQETDLEEEVKAALTSKLVVHMKQIGRPVTLTLII